MGLRDAEGEGGAEGVADLLRVVFHEGVGEAGFEALFAAVYGVDEGAILGVELLDAGLLLYDLRAVQAQAGLEQRFASRSSSLLPDRMAGYLLIDNDPVAQRRVAYGRQCYMSLPDSPHTYRLYVGGGQPGDGAGQWFDFTVTGSDTEVAK